MKSTHAHAITHTYRNRAFIRATTGIQLVSLILTTVHNEMAKTRNEHTHTQ